MNKLALITTNSNSKKRKRANQDALVERAKENQRPYDVIDPFEEEDGGQNEQLERQFNEFRDSGFTMLDDSPLPKFPQKTIGKGKIKPLPLRNSSSLPQENLHADSGQNEERITPSFSVTAANSLMHSKRSQGSPKQERKRQKTLDFQLEGNQPKVYTPFTKHISQSISFSLGSDVVEITRDTLDNSKV